jgi:DNA-directed RNA polymerase subunit RPC12/RpoP
MNDLNFVCPSCRQSLEAPEELLGQTVQCPSCSTTINVPHQMATASAYTPPPRMKDCPYCSEQILASAKKCKHCGEIVDIALRSAEQATKYQVDQISNASKHKSFALSNDANGKAWSGGEMAAYVVLTLLIPLTGLILGIVGLSNEARKGQAAGLLLFSIVLMIIYYIAISQNSL